MNRRTLTILVILAFAATIAMCIASNSNAPDSATTYLTLDGYDVESGLTIQAINLWVDYEDRAAGIAGTARHGDRVELVRREGSGVLVRAGSREGWVSEMFIREYRQQ